MCTPKIYFSPRKPGYGPGAFVTVQAVSDNWSCVQLGCRWQVIIREVEVVQRKIIASCNLPDILRIALQIMLDDDSMYCKQSAVFH